MAPLLERTFQQSVIDTSFLSTKRHILLSTVLDTFARQNLGLRHEAHPAPVVSQAPLLSPNRSYQDSLTGWR